MVVAVVFVMVVVKWSAYMSLNFDNLSSNPAGMKLIFYVLLFKLTEKIKKRPRFSHLKNTLEDYALTRD